MRSLRDYLRMAQRMEIRNVGMRQLNILILALASLCFWGSAANALEVDLYAGPFSKEMPGGVNVPMWGFGSAADGPFTVPGPVLHVPHDDDEGLTIHLYNVGIPEPISIVIPGQYTEMSPVFDGGTLPRMRSLTHEAAAGTGTATYTWTNLRHGTYLYHSGSHLTVQPQMGLYGAMIHDAGQNKAYSVESGGTPGQTFPVPDVEQIGDWKDGDYPGYAHAAPAGDDRLLVVMAHAEANAPATDFSGITYGGKVLTAAEERHQNQGSSWSATSEIWYLKEADIATASSAQIVANATTTGGVTRKISSVFYSGVDQGNPIATTGHDGENANNEQTLSVTLSGPDLDLGDRVVANATIRTDQTGSAAFTWKNDFVTIGEHVGWSSPYLYYSDASILATGNEVAAVVVANNGVGALAVAVLNHAAAPTAIPDEPGETGTIDYDQDVVLLYSEIDVALHNAVNANDFGTGKSMTSAIHYAPKYFLINGEAYQDGITPNYKMGEDGEKRLLLRFINAGQLPHVPTLLGQYMNLIAEDGFTLPFLKEQYSIFLPSGKTTDGLVTLTCSEGPGEPADSLAGRYPVYDRRLTSQTNAGTHAGGMLAFIEISDLDEDSVVTPCDNCTNISNTNQLDADADGFGNACDADLNNDGITNFSDVGSFVSAFGTSDPNADFNGDGMVNYSDVATLINEFGTAAGPE